MGKRNKGEKKDNNVKTKKNRVDNNSAEHNEVSEEVSAVESTGNGKNKKIVFDSDVCTKSEQVYKNINGPKPNTHSQSRNKHTKRNENNVENNKSKQNKRIIFTDDNDEGAEVTTTKSKPLKTSVEEEPIDDEIDKFCDELDEEDNVQYDNWVKLIEAKLGPNKKK